MNEVLRIQNIISIRASRDLVWDALINPEKTKKYMFGCETVSDWKEGSSLLWKGMYEGNEMIFVKGKILHFEPLKRLDYSVFDPNAGMEDIPENYLTVSYILNEKEGETTLTVTQGDYNIVADGERRYKESYNNGEGWNPILLSIKQLVEEN